MSDETNVNPNDYSNWDAYFDKAMTDKEASVAEEPAAEKQEEEKPTEEVKAEEPVKTEDNKQADTGKHKIKVSGEEIELTLEQLKARAQMGEDYTRKTQAVSEERKKIEEEKARIQEILVELEASKINKQAETKVEQTQTPQQQGNLTAKTRDMFLKTYGEPYEWYNEEHQEKMFELTKNTAVQEAKNEILQMFRKEQEEAAKATTQQELAELSVFASTEPKEVLDFVLQSIPNVAQTDANKFIILHSANEKIRTQRFAELTALEARTLKEHAIASRKAYYASSKEKEEPQEMRTETTSSTARVDSKIKGSDIRGMDRSSAEKEFERYMKGG